ncbi:MAG: CAP domain-containing protein [Firmicutes bacterium]|nr:CAP domain-containing protein [Bacillota bacterium]
MLSLLNEQRRINGLSALKIDPKLEAMARRYCQEMITNRFFSHTSPVSGGLLNRIMDSEIPNGWLLAGENLAGAPTVEAAFEGLMQSPSHKDNMLEPKYTHAGIAVIDGGPYGKMFVQEFIEYPEDMLSKAANDSQSNLAAFLSANLFYPESSILDFSKSTGNTADNT